MKVVLGIRDSSAYGGLGSSRKASDNDPQRRGPDTTFAYRHRGATWNSDHQDQIVSDLGTELRLLSERIGRGKTSCASRTSYTSVWRPLNAPC